MIRSGKLTEDDPVELVDGILVFKTPKKSQHTTCTALLRRALEPLLGAGWHYRSEQPVTLADGEPEPDGVIVRGTIETYAFAHPLAGDVALVIEIADGTLDRNRGIKLGSCSRAGIPHYWIVNLVDRQVELFASPDSAASPSPMYLKRAVLTFGEQLSLTLPDTTPVLVPVLSILPPV